jgi:hypothetical protein
LSDKSQTFYEVAKEITIAAIEKGLIILPGKGNFDSPEEVSDYNQQRATEIGDFYKTIAKAVSEAMVGEFTPNS